MRKLLLPLTAAVALGVAITAPSALADGPCGQNYDFTTACAVSGPGTIHGTIVDNSKPNPQFDGAGGEDDYYKFYAAPGTVLSVTITDDYACDASVFLVPNTEAGCGELVATLPISDIDTIDSTTAGIFVTGDGTPGGIMLVHDTATLNAGPLDGGGTYYLTVSGEGPFVSQVVDGPTSPPPTWFPMPYTINVSVSAGSIQAPPPPDTTDNPPPPPPPPTTVTPTPTPTPTPVTTTVPAPTTAPVKAIYCVVPRFAGQTLSTVKHRLAVNHCMAHVQRVKQSSVPRRFRRLKAGSVFALMAGSHALTPGNKLVDRPSSSSVVVIQVVGPKSKLAATRSR